MLRRTLLQTSSLPLLSRGALLLGLVLLLIPVTLAHSLTKPSTNLATPTTTTTTTTTVHGIPVHPVPLQKDYSVYALAVSSISKLPPTANFLATQVWPSARIASQSLRAHPFFRRQNVVVCEFGCGPGLPSLTAASLGYSVLATDVDPFALELVQTAAAQQGLQDRIQTLTFDLLSETTTSATITTKLLQKLSNSQIDLAIFSDVFENDRVARGAAAVTLELLEQGATVWTFAQSDRAQREVYRQVLQTALQQELTWTPPTQPQDPAVRDSSLMDGEDEESTGSKSKNLWLCDLDETTVLYQ